ncbi:MAG: efflux RND transporter permease subunit [Sphaerochaetaceae bacterium]
MKISELSVRRPVLITMIYAVILIIAAMLLSNLQVSLYPSVSMPVISVSVDCNDAGPEEIESQVAEPLESALSSISGLESMTSESSDGRCQISLEFSYGTDLDEAADDVSSAISRVTRSLPDWADTPEVMNFNSMSTSSEIMNLSVSGDYTSEKLYSIAEDTISPLLLRIDGVEEVEVRGFGSKQYTLEIDPDKLEQYGLSITDIVNAISSTNVQGKGGTLTQEGMDYTIAIDGRYTDSNQILDTLISTVGNNEIRVSDIASLSIESSQSFRESYIDDQSVIMLSVSNSSDSTAATVAQAIRNALPSIQEQAGEHVNLSIQRDSTTMITSTMNEVYQSAYLGIILAAAIIFLFLRGIKTTFIIAISMPISILITLLLMSVAGISVNTMSMSGMILGIGMIVDASIVILENTYRLREQGKSSVEAAILGSQNMTNAILASTLTTICVFIPLIIYKTSLGEIGMMFQDLILTVCIALGASLFVSITLVPALCGSILRINTRVQKPLKWIVLRSIDDFCAMVERGLENAYAATLGFCLRHKLLIVVLIALLLVFSLMFVGNIGMSLTPQMNADDSVSVSLSMPSGTNKSVTREEVFRVESLVRSALPDGSFTTISTDIQSTSGTIEIAMPNLEEQKYTASDIKGYIRQVLNENDNPDATWAFSAGRGPMSSSAIDIAIRSEDTDLAKEAADQIIAILNQHAPDAIDLSSDLADGAPKLDIEINQEMADVYGVTAQDIYTAVSQALNGVTATTLSTFSTDTTYSLVAQLDEDKFNSLEDIGSLLITTTRGNVRLDSLADFSYSSVPKTITREDKVTVSHVTANVSDGVSSSTVTDEVQNALDQYLVLPDGVTISMEGDMTQFSDYGGTLITIILLALLLVFAVMAAQFESLIDPFIIFATIPTLIIGVVWVHIWAGQDFTLYSIVGIIALIGVVVNNGIVMVDSINQLVRKKTPIYQACMEAARTRLRPILMTTLTTVLGMVPMAFFPGEGSSSMQPIALTFVGGLLTGSFMTLFLSPILYCVFNRNRSMKYSNPNALINQLAQFDAKYPKGSN